MRDHIIRLPHGKTKKLAKDFKVSTKTVYRAVRGETNSPQANMLRKAALEHGGKVYKNVPDANFIPNYDTSFETADNYMVQTFGEKVRIYFNLTTGTAEIYVDGVLHSTHNDVTFKNITEVQKEAQRLADELIDKDTVI